MPRVPNPQTPNWFNLWNHHLSPWPCRSNQSMAKLWGYLNVTRLRMYFFFIFYFIFFNKKFQTLLICSTASNGSFFKIVLLKQKKMLKQEFRGIWGSMKRAGRKIKRSKFISPSKYEKFGSGSRGSSKNSKNDFLPLMESPEVQPVVFGNSQNSNRVIELSHVSSAIWIFFLLKIIFEIIFWSHKK